MSAQIILPRIMQVGAKSSQLVGSIVETLNCKRPLIVTDKMMTSLGYVEKIQQSLLANEITAEVFDDTLPEPTAASIMAGVDKVRDGNFDVIIALGGGSPIDSAKAISILGKHGGVMRDYKFPRQVNEAGLPVIAISTTAGTGSEVTRVTIITDENNDEKMLCIGLGFMPVAALIDYELTLSVPKRTTADTGIDSLTHAMEAYVSQKANLYSDTQAIAAMKLLGPNLQTAYNEPNNKQAREKMMLGATLAGVAFSNASVALVHGMSRPIGAMFHVPHGLSNAMLLPDVTEFSIPAAPERYATCAKAIGFADNNDSVENSNEKLLKGLRALNKNLAVPTLKEFGADQTTFFRLLDEMASQAKASGSPANNPKVATHDEMVTIYKNLW